MSRPASDHQSIPFYERHFRAEALWNEVVLAEGTPGDIDRFPFVAVADNRLWLPGAEFVAHLSDAFKRARTIQVLSLRFVSKYWVDLGYAINPDPEMEPQIEGVHAATMRLAQLVVLSRVEVPDPGQYSPWDRPKGEAIYSVVRQMQAELGVTEASDEPRGTSGYVTFPGISSWDFAAAILEGRLLVGNPDQPTAIASVPDSYRWTLS